MKPKSSNNPVDHQKRQGVVLLVTLVLLVVLSTLGYTLSSRVTTQRRRDHYVVDYAVARYGCDSAVKYALATLEELNPTLISRPNEPDFSDLFAMSETDYQKLLSDWASGVFGDIEIPYDANNVSDINDVNNIAFAPDFNDTNSLKIRGPYGQDWPLVTKPIELKIGSAMVTIEIEDENAKYPLGWAMLNEKDSKREAKVALEVFSEWMDVNSVVASSLKKQLKEINKIKPYQFEFKAIRISDRRMGKVAGPRGTRKTVRTSEARKIPASVHLTDFARLFHSSLVETDTLAKPTIVSETRTESPLKYMGRWGSTKVNVNTAPRHVLEAAFTFGGDADKIAEEIIQRRRIKPFENIDDLKKSLFGYSDSIDKCERYITTVSRFFTIKVTVIHGMSKVSAVAAVIKEGKEVERVALISG